MKRNYICYIQDDRSINIERTKIYGNDNWTNAYTIATEPNIQQGMNQGGKYAVFIIDHTAEAVQKAWSEIFREVSNKGYIIDFSRDIIERYAVKMIKNHKCEICVPII